MVFSRCFNLLCIWVSLIQWTPLVNLILILLFSHLNHGPCLSTLYSPHSLLHGCGICSSEARAWEQMRINVIARTTGPRGSVLHSSYLLISWAYGHQSLDPDHVEDSTGGESLHCGSLQTWGRSIIILSPMWVCNCPAQPQSPRVTHGESAGLWSPAHHEVSPGQKAGKWHQRLQEGWQNRGMNFTLSL